MLLHRLAMARASEGYALRAVHVDHGLHPASADWAQHCVAVAADLGLALAVHRVTVERRASGLEAAARQARWRALCQERQADECLVLAHHRRDQAETLLLALMRGSGERGLAAMRPYVVDTRGPIWRPFLDTPVEALADYARAHGLHWVEDPANRDPAFARHTLRQDVLPLLGQRWPGVEQALAHSARHLAEADALLTSQAQEDLARLLGLDPAVIELAGLALLPLPRAQRALRLWAESLGAKPTSDALKRVTGPWRNAPPGRPLRHALGAHWLRQWGGRLWLTPREPMPAGPPAEGHVWDGRSPLMLGQGASLQLLGAPQLDPVLRWVARSQAPTTFLSDARRPERPLRDLFASLGVPPWQREAVPLLVDPHGQLVALGDLAYAPGFDAWLRERGARLLWQGAQAHG